MTIEGGSVGLAERFDHFSEEFFTEPHAFWSDLREKEPLARSEQHGGYYLVSRYDDIKEAAADPGRFSSAQSTGIPPLPIVGMIPIDLDPPAHREYRKILNPHFRTKEANQYEDRIRELAGELIDSLLKEEEFEVAEGLATQVPPRTMLTIIGFPEDRWDVVIKSVDDVTRLRGSDPQEVINAGMALMEQVTKLVGERREAPKDDLIDKIIASPVTDPETGEVRPLEEQEMVRMIAIILFGAIDTTSLAITGSLHFLATHPAAQEHLRTEGISPDAIEELVRWICPIQGLGRTVTEDTELAGCPLREGDKVMLLWGSGNRQSSVFDNPDEVDFGRDPNPHLGFGHGPHKCLGRNYGKLMLRVTLEEFLSRVGPFELADPDSVSYVGGETRGIKNLVLRRAR